MKVFTLGCERKKHDQILIPDGKMLSEVAVLYSEDSVSEASNGSLMCNEVSRLPGERPVVDLGDS